MSIQVVFHALAAKDARAAEAWYAERSVEAASGFRAAVRFAADRIANNRATHAMGATRFRYVRVLRFPYRLIYCIDSPTIARVIAVAHDRRRPGYWRRRK